MSIKKINEFPEGSGNLSADDVFLFMDDPTGNGITKKISLADLTNSIGVVAVSGNFNTGDITFNGSTISTANTDQSMTITTNGSGDIYIGADKNMIFDMNAFSAKGILLQDSQEDGYDDPTIPSVLKVGSIYHDTGTMVIKSDGRIVDSSGNLLQTYGGIWITNGDQTGFRVPPPTGSNSPLGYDTIITNNEHSWNFTPNGDLAVPGNILLNNGTTIATGTFDNGTGGNNGISLNCYVGYELNWQGGHLKSTQDNGLTASNIYCDSSIAFPGSGLNYMEINASGIIFSDGTTQQTAPNNLVNIFNHGTVSGSNSINYDLDRSIQTLTLNGSAVTFTKGSGWPTSSNISCDIILRITVSSATSITWSIVTDWFNQAPAGALSVGTHLFLLRAIGSSIIEGHYISKKSN